MSRKLIYLLALSLASPAMVSAATWTVKASSAQPTLGAVSPSGYQTYTDSGSHSFNVAPFEGYSTTKILLDGANVGTRSPISVTYNAARLSRNLTAYFIGKTYQVTATQAPGGSISSSTSSTVAYGKDKSFTITPNLGSAVADVIVDGAHIDPSTLPVVGSGRSYTFTAVKASHTITAVFGTVTAEAGVDQGVIVGKEASLSGSGKSPGGSIAGYQWSVASQPAGSGGGTLSAANSATTQFTPDVSGLYVLKLTVTDSANKTAEDNVSVTAYASAADASMQCYGCHSGTTAGTQMINAYNGSIHKDDLTCTGCHSGAQTTAHPGDVTSQTVSKVSFKDSGNRSYADPTGNYYCLNSACHTTTNIWTRDLSKSSHFASANSGNCSSCHSTEMHNPASTFTDGCGQCHSAPADTYASKHFTGSAAATFAEGNCRQCHTGNVSYGYSTTPDYANGVFTRTSSARASKHRPETWQYATSDVCATCHSDLRTEFRTTKHWNNNLEYGPEFSGGAVEGQMNANESWTTTENGSLTTCSTRCHFKPNLGPNPKAKNTNALNSPGKDECLACHDPHKLTATYITCMDCHRQTNATRAPNSGHGAVPYEFWGSKHWQNNFEYGPEFANQTDTAVSGKDVTNLGTKTDGYLNANDSYTTTENGSTVTCAYRCHFRPGMGPSQNVGTVLANGKSTGYITYTDSVGKYGAPGTVYSRPGGDACMACHDAHSLEASAQSTCYTCHAGGNHGWSVAAFEKSTHFTGATAKAEGMDKEACLACHNAHSTEAAFGAYSSLAPVAATGCQACHTPGSAYGIYNADQSGTAPHFQTGTADAGGYFPTASYTTAGGATCADCHYHNNSVNAGWAEGGHGKVDAAAFVSNASHNWNGQGTDGVNYQVSPQKTNCIRCHTARGFAQYWDSGFQNIGKVYLDPVAKTLDKASAPLVCSGCHSGVKGAVRPMPVGFTKVKSFYGYSTVSIAPAKMVATLEFTDNKNSNICIPCHSQRAVGTGIKALFAQGAFKQYSVGTAMYPHEAQPAAIVDGKGGYEFTSAQGYQDRMRHIRIGNYGTGTGYNNTGVTSGNCSGCHMTSTTSHSLEAVTADATTGQINGIVSSACVKCHPTAFTYQDIQAKKDAFNAAVKALGNLLVTKGFTLDGVNVMPERKAFDMSLGTKNNAIAEKNIGAWFNWYLFKTADKAAYIHNPAYSRRLINDSIDWLDDNIMNDSAAATVFAQQTAGTITAQEKDQALAQLNNPGCMGCHFGTGSTLNGEAVPGIAQAPHYNTTGATVPGETFTQAQFVTPGTQCNYCHGYGHGTDSPGSTVLKQYAESAHGEIDGLAWTDYDFKTRATCNACHTTTGFVKAVSNNFTNTAAWGTAADSTKQVLGCNACHTSTAWKSYSSATGSLTSSIRTITGGYTAGMGGYGASAKATVKFSDQGESNVCIPCHASRENGDSLRAGNYNFTNKTFVNPHYLGSAAVWQGTGGFKFYSSAARYAVNKPTHGVQTADLGSVGHSFNSRMTTQQLQKGSCVACHIGFKGNHTFNTYSAVKYGFMNRDTKVQGEAVDGCLGCHSGTNNGYNRYYPTVENGQGNRATSGGYVQQRALDFLRWQFEQVGIYFNNSKNAYFFTDATYATGVTNWTTQLVGKDNGNGTGLETMGAAMNLKLLATDKGAAAHNAAFTRAVIADSLVYLQHGNVGDRSSTAPINNISFTGYSTAITPVLGGAPTDGNPATISNLKSFLTSGGKRR